MEAPRLDELKPGKMIGRGGSGRVFQAAARDGSECAVKVFERGGISGGILESSIARLEAGGWPAGVMPVTAAGFATEPPCWITPLRAAVMADGAVVPRNLQSKLDEHPGTESWKVVKSLIRALAAMHGRRVVHGNLKPGNVFFGDDGGVLLADWAMGNMPGVAKFKFTDAVLYQAPEQLRDPAGYATDAGFRWDAFAFGVLAFRVLTGRFPRCHETFQAVAPAAGASLREGIQADMGKIAGNLEAQPAVSWPDSPHNELEAGFRDWIDRCLALDPALRPATMGEVAAGFDELERKFNRDGEREALLDQRRHAEQRARRALFFAGAASATAIVLGGLWYVSHLQQERRRVDQERLMTGLKSEVDVSAQGRKDAEKAWADARGGWESERGKSLERLASARTTGDRLFAWAMEKGNRSLPPLDGREVRLKALERELTEFLDTSAKQPALEGERARARLQLAEIALSAGDSVVAGKRLGEALAGLREGPMDPALKLRVATDWLLLALLRQTGGDPDAGASFVAARRALEEVPATEVSQDRLGQLMAVLDFREAQLLASRGDDRQALDQLMRATQTLNRLADLRPDLAILRSELADCYLSSATVLEGMGSLGDAREVRTLASVELQKLIKAQPGDFTLRLDLAGCYGAMAESAVLSGDVTGADSLSRSALELLDALVSERPDDAEAVSRKAAQLGLRAGIERDRGQTAQALKDYDEGVRLLEALHAKLPDNGLVSYRLALLWWQKGRLLGMAGERDKEIVLIDDARERLMELDARPPSAGPRADQLRSSLAYLLGDLGHSQQLAGRKNDSLRTFGDAVKLWEKLLESHPKSEEYSEGLAWCRQRLDDLK